MVRFLLVLTALLFALPGVASAQAFHSDRITVETVGSGPDVILIPGLASTPEVWRRTARRLDDDHRVHLVAIRGFGTTDGGANVRGAVSGPVAAEIRRYIAERRLNRPAVVGHSLGGQIALRLAAHAPGSVGRVMVVDSSPFFPSLISLGATTGDVEPVARIAYQAVLFLGDEALRRQGDVIGEQLGGASDAIFGAMGWQGGDRRVVAQALYEVMTSDLRHRLPSVRAPVTVVYGWSSAEGSPRAQVDRAFRDGYRNLPTAPVYERIEGAQHMVMIDQPTRFMAVLNRFLE